MEPVQNYFAEILLLFFGETLPRLPQGFAEILLRPQFSAGKHFTKILLGLCRDSSSQVVGAAAPPPHPSPPAPITKWVIW